MIMKTKLHIIILLIVVNSVAYSQGNFQTYPTAGFKVKCGCKLAVNSVFIQASKSQGANNILGAYICAENENDPQTGVIVNINVYDESKNFQNIKSTYHEYFKKKSLEKYAANLKQAGYSYEYVNFQGESALEYNFDQNGVPTKAIMFFKNQKSYLLQVATRSNLISKYNSLKNSFVII